MLEVCLLGTGGMMPLPNRWLTSVFMKCEGSALLIDCGEGTQVALKEKRLSSKPIDIICFTHFHADHISGLPGFLLTMGNFGRTEPVMLIGPKGLENVVNALRTIAPEIPFTLKFTELSEQRKRMEFPPYVIDACQLDHKVSCYGYAVSIPRAGRFDVQKALKNNVPQAFWNRLQHGGCAEHEGRLLTPDMVLGPERRGLKVTYCTDTRPLPVIAEYAEDADLFICEGIYGDEKKYDKAVEYRHMTFREAAEIGKQSLPRRMWLTHYSPSLTDPKAYIGEAKKIFPRIEAGKDGCAIDLSFDGE